jgi:hypothetical protein
MHTTLATAKGVQEFNSEYYLAIVTILPILMVGTDILANFAKSITRETQSSWKPLFYALVSFFYLGSPVIAAAGVATGVLALMYQDGNAEYKWISFICFISVLVFLAIASVVYLAASDPVKDVKVFKKRERRQAEPVSETRAGTGEAGGSSTQT